MWFPTIQWNALLCTTAVSAFPWFPSVWWGWDRLAVQIQPLLGWPAWGPILRKRCCQRRAALAERRRWVHSQPVPSTPTPGKNRKSFCSGSLIVFPGFTSWQCKYTSILCSFFFWTSATSRSFPSYSGVVQLISKTPPRSVSLSNSFFLA